MRRGDGCFVRLWIMAGRRADWEIAGSWHGLMSCTVSYSWNEFACTVDLTGLDWIGWDGMEGRVDGSCTVLQYLYRAVAGEMLRNPVIILSGDV